MKKGEKKEVEGLNAVDKEDGRERRRKSGEPWQRLLAQGIRGSVVGASPGVALTKTAPYLPLKTTCSHVCQAQRFVRIC